MNFTTMIAALLIALLGKPVEGAIAPSTYEESLAALQDTTDTEGTYE